MYFVGIGFIVRTYNTSDEVECTRTIMDGHQNFKQWTTSRSALYHISERLSCWIICSFSCSKQNTTLNVLYLIIVWSFNKDPLIIMALVHCTPSCMLYVLIFICYLLTFYTIGQFNLLLMAPTETNEVCIWQDE